MSLLTVENRLLIKVLASVIRSRGPHAEHRTLFTSQICLKDFSVNFVFKYFTCQLQNKEYLIAVFRPWLLSCKEFLSAHFAENRMTL